jgi:hypothetical protein
MEHLRERGSHRDVQGDGEMKNGAEPFARPRVTDWGESATCTRVDVGRVAGDVRRNLRFGLAYALGVEQARPAHRLSG